MVRIVLLSAIMQVSLCAATVFAVDPTSWACDFSYRPAAEAWRLNGDVPNLSIAAFEHGLSKMPADFHLADFIAKNRNRLFDGAAERAASNSLSAELAALGDPWCDPHQDQRFSSHQQLSPLIARWPAMSRTSSFADPWAADSWAIDATTSYLQPAIAEVGKGTPWCDALRWQ